MPDIKSIRTSVKDRHAELLAQRDDIDAELPRLEALLGDDDTPSQAPEQPTTILEALRAADGPLRRGEIAKVLGVPPESLSRKLAKLRDAGEVKQSGNTAGARYSPR